MDVRDDPGGCEQRNHFGYGSFCPGLFVIVTERVQEVLMRKLVAIAVVTGALLVSACNTVEGVGKDVKSAGDTVAKTAGDAK